MSRDFNSYMHTWVRMLNENTYNPSSLEDEPEEKVSETTDVYASLKKDIDKYYDDVEKTGNTEGNLKLGEGCTKESCCGKETVSEEEDQKLDKEISEIKDVIADKVKDITIVEWFEGDGECEIEFKDGTTKTFPFSIPQSDIDNVMKDLLEKSGGDEEVPITEDDAIIAIIRSMFGTDIPMKAETEKGKKVNLDFDKWFAEEWMKDVEEDYLAGMGMTDKKRFKSRAQEMFGYSGAYDDPSLFQNDEGDFNDDDNFDAETDTLRGGSYTDNTNDDW